MPYIEQRVFISREDYSLRRSGPKNAARHDEKVKDAIKGNLDQIIFDGAIITADPKSKKRVRIPLRSLILPHIIHKESKDGVGSGPGDVGDVISTEPGQGSGQGAGQTPGQETYETEILLEDLQALVFADLGLPFLKPKQHQQLETDTILFDDVRAKKTPGNLDIFRTLTENMKRNAIEGGEARIFGIRPEDYRVRTWRNEVRQENAAAVIFKRDFSGSMGPVETYLVQAFGWWTVAFLRSKYPKVETAFIVHDTQAYEVSESDYFRRNDGGGTTCSSAYVLEREIIDKRFSPDRYNVYSLHFSDGDNWNNDDQKCVGLVREMLGLGVAQVGFIQVASSSNSSLRTALTAGIQHDRFAAIVVPDKKAVLPGLKAYFNAQKQFAA